MIRNLAAIAALFVATGCDGLQAKFSETTCLSEDGHQTVFGIFGEQIERSISKDLPNEVHIDKGKIRAAIKQLKFEIADVRTSKEDPDSTKKFCTGNLRVSFPPSVLDEADQALAATESGTVSDFANEYDYQRNANSFKIPIDFTVQPTDDGEAIYAELEDGDNPIRFLSNVLSAQLLRPKIVNAQIEQQRVEEEQAKAERDAAEAAAAADLTEAKTNNQLAEQSINATWGSLSQESRNQLLNIQRAWIKKKDTSCRLEAAQASTDNTQREIARLNCNARMNNDRADYLARYLDEAYEGYD